MKKRQVKQSVQLLASHACVIGSDWVLLALWLVIFGASQPNQYAVLDVGFIIRYWICIYFTQRYAV